MLTRIVEDNPEIQQLRERIAGVDEDASYYDRIKLGEAISHSMDRLQQVDADATLDALERYAVATVVKEPGGENGAVHVAFLVRSDHRSDFERAVDDLGDEWSGRVEPAPHRPDRGLRLPARVRGSRRGPGLRWASSPSCSCCPSPPSAGSSWIAEQIEDQVDYRLNDPGVIRAQIDELDAAFEREEITEAERDEQQEVLLRRLVGQPAADPDPGPEGPA